MTNFINFSTNITIDGEVVLHEAGKGGGECLAADDHVPVHHEDPDEDEHRYYID